MPLGELAARKNWDYSGLSYAAPNLDSDQLEILKTLVRGRGGENLEIRDHKTFFNIFYIFSKLGNLLIRIVCFPARIRPTRHQFSGQADRDGKAIGSRRIN